MNRWIFTEDTGLVFVLIPGGTFRMGAERPPLGVEAQETPEGFLITRGGAELEHSATAKRGIDSPNVDPVASDKESPVHDMALEPFFLSKYEMTQGQWLRFVGQNPSRYAAGQSSAGTSITAAHPVEQVSWDDADGVLRKLGLLLPTESQWEYACRAGTSSVWHTGGVPGTLAGHANIADEGSARFYSAGWNFEKGFTDGFGVHAPVGSFTANAFGLHDVHGNVWECCRDHYTDYGTPARAGDGLRDAPGVSDRALRGGSFGNPAVFARSANRFWDAPAYRDFSLLGLRPSRVITE